MNGRQRPPSSNNASPSNGFLSSNITYPGPATPAYQRAPSGLALPRHTSATSTRHAPVTPSSSLGISTPQTPTATQAFDLAGATIAQQSGLRYAQSPSFLEQPHMLSTPQSNYAADITMQDQQHKSGMRYESPEKARRGPATPYPPFDPRLTSGSQSQNVYTSMPQPNFAMQSIEAMHLQASVPSGVTPVYNTDASLIGYMSGLDDLGPRNDGGHDDAFSWDGFDKRTCVQCDKPVPKKMTGNLCRRCQHKKDKEEAGPPNIPHLHMESAHARDIVHAHRPPLVPDNQSEHNLRMRELDLRSNNTADGVRMWIERMLNAINEPYDLTLAEAASVGRNLDQHNALLKTQMDFNKKFFDQPAQYEFQRINARVRLLWDTVVCLHTGGVLPYEEGGDNSGYNVDTELRFSSRLQRICDMLQLDKRICIDVIEGRGVTAFARDPWSYEKRKQDNITSNNKKSKAAKDRAGVSTTDSALFNDPAQQQIRRHKALIADPKRDGKVVGQKRKSEGPADHVPIKRQASSHYRSVHSAAEHSDTLQAPADVYGDSSALNIQATTAALRAAQIARNQVPNVNQQQTHSRIAPYSAGDDHHASTTQPPQRTVGSLSYPSQSAPAGSQGHLAMRRPQHLVTPGDFSSSSGQSSVNASQRPDPFLKHDEQVTTDKDGTIEQQQNVVKTEAFWEVAAPQTESTTNLTDRSTADLAMIMSDLSPHMTERIDNGASDVDLSQMGSWLPEPSDRTGLFFGLHDLDDFQHPTSGPGMPDVAPLDFHMPDDIAGATNDFDHSLLFGSPTL